MSKIVTRDEPAESTAARYSKFPSVLARDLARSLVSLREYEDAEEAREVLRVHAGVIV